MSVISGVGIAIDEAMPLTTEAAARLHNLAPVLLGPVADSMRATEAGVFHTAGGSVGNVWAPLADATLRRKHGNSAELLVEEGMLRASLTERNAIYSHVEMDTPQSLSFGTDDPVAGFHQGGTINMPARPPVPDPWPEEDVEHWTELILDWVLDGKL